MKKRAEAVTTAESQRCTGPDNRWWLGCAWRVPLTQNAVTTCVECAICSGSGEAVVNTEAYFLIFSHFQLLQYLRL